MSLDKFHSTQKVGGFDISNILDPAFFAKKNKSPVLSFEVENIEIINDAELLKVRLKNSLLIRFMKITTENNQPALIFDIIDTSLNEILFKSYTPYIGGLGISNLMYRHEWITQWEATPFTLLCRSFVFGDIAGLTNLVKEFNLKFSKDADWFVKNHILKIG